MSYALIFDAIVAVLLAITIIYAVILNRKLSVLRSARGEMERLLGSFGEATAKVEHGLAGARDAAQGAAQELRKQIEAGRGLADDLAFLVQRGSGLADKLDIGTAGGRGAAAAARPAAMAGAGSFAGSSNGGSVTELDRAAQARDASRRHQAAGMATAAIGPDHDGEAATGALSPKQAALLKALKAIR